MTSISLLQICKRYPTGVTAIEHLSLEFPDRQLVVVVGPSGCGKTTLLRLIAGLEDPTSGSIRFDGRLANADPPRVRNVGMVFQRPALYPHLSVRRNLAFGASLQGFGGPFCWLARRLIPSGDTPRGVPTAAQIEERVDRIAGLLHLSGELDRLPGELSGGQQQRVALGRALVREPGVYLLDEPLSSLDGPLRLEMRRELHLLHRRLPATMIYVTHDPVEAVALADRVAILRAGRLQQVGSPGEVLDRPVNRFVAGFIGWPPMSFLDGVWEQRNGLPGLAQAGSFLPCSGQAASKWSTAAGRRAALGFRVNAVTLEPCAHAEASLRMKVTLVEQLGESCLVTLSRDEWQVTALVRRACCPRPEEEHETFFDMSNAYLFDGVTGARVPEG